VLAHVGLCPQSVNALGGYKVQGKSDDAARVLMNDAIAVEEAGAFAVVIEGTAEPTAAALTRALSIPTIGIGASAACDGQILVTEDVLGLTPPPHARFVKNYTALHDISRAALAQFADDVKKRTFPAPEHTYSADIHAVNLKTSG
jgi:3-methyl-2-oxobutanoate hydroxymethyltransferase